MSLIGFVKPVVSVEFIAFMLSNSSFGSVGFFYLLLFPCKMPHCSVTSYFMEIQNLPVI